MASSIHAVTATEPAASGLLDVVQNPQQCRLHVHDYLAMEVGSQSAAKRASGDRRAERALVMAGPGDIVVLAQDPDPGFLEYLTSLGVGARAEHVITLGSEQGGKARRFASLGRDARLSGCLADRIAARVDGGKRLRLTTYYWTRLLEQFRRGLEHHLGRTVTADAGCPDATVLANRKDWIRAEAVRLGIPVASGVVLSSAQFGDVAAALHEGVMRAAHQQFLQSGGAVIRGAWSTSGADVRIERHALDLDDLAAWLEARLHVDAFLVEEFLPLRASPNVQLWIGDDGDITVAGIFDQRLSRSGSHFGNAHPFDACRARGMEQACVALAEALAGRGYRGPLGLDLIDRADGSGFALAEANGRMNASTYACTLFEAINRQRTAVGMAPLGAWLSHGDVEVGPRRFAAVENSLGELLYTHGATAGVIPYNTGLLAFGRLDLLVVAGNPDHAAAMEQQALARLR